MLPQLKEFNGSQLIELFEERLQAYCPVSTLYIDKDPSFTTSAAVLIIL